MMRKDCMQIRLQKFLNENSKEKFMKDIIRSPPHPWFVEKFEKQIKQIS